MSLFAEVVIAEVYVRTWLQTPELPRGKYPGFSAYEKPEQKNLEPFTQKEIQHHIDVLKKHAPTTYRKYFPEGSSH